MPWRSRTISNRSIRSRIRSVEAKFSSSGNKTSSSVVYSLEALPGAIPKGIGVISIVGGSEDIQACIPRLRRYARALTGDRFSADDLVQDTLERAWGRFHLWRRGSNLHAWLFTIMHNLFVNQIKKRQAGRVVPLDHENADFAAPPTQEARLAIRDLDAALRRLPDEQREVLLLVGLEEMSYREVARVVGVPVGTVMSRLSRGRERLRALMKGEAPPQPLKVVK